MINLWDLQLEFEKKFFKYKNLNINELNLEQKRIWTKEFYMHIIVELSEMINSLQYKMHRNYIDEINENNIKENLIDAQKLLMGLSQLWFNDYYEFKNLFIDKSIVVDLRFEFEKVQNIALTNKNIAIIDIDGVLADLEYSMMEFIKEKFSDFSHFKNTREIKNKFPIEYEKIKAEFRLGKYHRNIKLIDKADDFINKLAKDFKIIIITARPYEKYNNLWADTMYWLKNNNIKFDALYFDNKKHEKIIEIFKNNLSNIKFIVDDSAEICKQVEKIGIKSFKIDHKNITFNTILNSIEK
jgi:hypothetical protein